MAQLILYRSLIDRDLKNKPTLITAAIIVIVVSTVIFLNLDKDAIKTNSGTRSETWDSVPQFTKVPEIGEAEFTDNIAIPASVVPEVKTLERYETASMTRTFEISVFEDKFSPDTVIVYEGDRPRIKITAIDKDYDFIQPDYGVKQTVFQGETKLVSFRAGETGKFTFFCESCGGPEKGPVGYIIIKKNE